MRCDGHFIAGVRETEPTPPDANGDRWKTFEHTGNISFSCSHGLVVSGPREQVAPLVKLHIGDPLTRFIDVARVFGSGI